MHCLLGHGIELFFLKQENKLMTWQQINQWGILHSKHKVRVKWTLLIGVVVGWSK